MGAATPSRRDHNLRGAYLHVLADALTSVPAILALSLGKVFHIFWLDATMGIVGSILIARWAYNLGRDTALELCDKPSGLPDCVEGNRENLLAK